MKSKNINNIYTSTAKQFLPGISQLFGKRPDINLPGNDWPNYYSKSKGIHIWDLNNKKYLDFSMVGIGTSVLGYSNKKIVNKAKKILDSGTMTTLNPPEDVDLAKSLIKLHPWAQSVKYCGTGGESMAVAVRIARAYTKREKILFCGYHGWHDWYLSANLKNSKTLGYHLLPGISTYGIPKNLKNSVVPFRFNNFDDLNKVVKKHAVNAAAIIIEPAREKLVDKKFLKELKRISNKNKCILIFDEITSGWRLTNGGVHKVLKINPDIAVFGKTMANGIPMGAIIGKKKIIESSLNTFISSAFWTERLGPACALEFIKIYSKEKINNKLIHIGKKIKKIWINKAKKYNLKIKVEGIDPLASFSLNYKNWPAILTYFIQEMLLKHRIIASSRCYANLMHKDKEIKKYEKAIDDVFSKIKTHIQNNTIEKSLRGPIKQMGFNRLTKK